MQKILSNCNFENDFTALLNVHHVKSCMLVCGNSFKKQNIYGTIRNLCKGINWCEFTDFCPNPEYESVVKAVNLFKKNKCDFIIAAGGGSAIDVGKCVKSFSTMHTTGCYLSEKITGNNIPFLAVPTTAGTGSESTSFAVIYYNGEKQSVSHISALPQYVLLEPSTLNSLPLYQKSSTMMDAFSHAIEAAWSVNSTSSSWSFSKEAIKIILCNYEAYLNNDISGNRQMLLASNLAGKAINIAKTTAGHAMCYKLTSLYNISHGHAASLCLKQVWWYMLKNMDKCIDSRGRYYLEQVFQEIAITMGCVTTYEALDKFSEILYLIGLEPPILNNIKDLEILASSVNTQRLKNNPVSLDFKVLYDLYSRIFNIEENMHGS